MTIVAKFGGSSLANAERIIQACDIIQSSHERSCIVVSAPGAQYPGDIKVTDALGMLVNAMRDRDEQGVKTARAFVQQRFEAIVDDLNIDFDLQTHLRVIREACERNGCSAKDWIISRGEWLNAQIVAKKLGYTFIDAEDFICLNGNQRWNPEYTKAAWRNLDLPRERIVVPGYYGRDNVEQTRTFKRGGSDITGAIMAVLLDAQKYENWTDVDGVLVADPRITQNPLCIPEITYLELRELAYMGARVLNPESLIPELRQKGITVHVRNTFNPDTPGTKIVPEATEDRIPGSVVGIAGRKGFSSIDIYSYLMQEQVGFVGTATAKLAVHDISIDHVPTGIDMLSLVIASDQLDGKADQIQRALQQSNDPDSMVITNDLALICVVGSAMANNPGVLMRAAKAFADADVNIELVSQARGEKSMVFGIKEDDYERAVTSIYAEFFE